MSVIKNYKLSLKEFATPSWWFSHWKKTEDDIGEPDYSKAPSLSLQNCQLLPLDIKERITVHSIILKRNNVPDVILTLSLMMLMYGTMFLLIYRKKTNRDEVSYKKLEWTNKRDEDTDKIIRYLAEHYANPELGVEMLQKELGLSESRIYNVFKDQLRSSVKKYINTLRLKEAKRLLADTDRQISEIAYKVGYSNVPHFNRLFKEVTGASPNEYRKKLVKSSN